MSAYLGKENIIDGSSYHELSDDDESRQAEDAESSFIGASSGFSRQKKVVQTSTRDIWLGQQQLQSLIALEVHSQAMPHVTELYLEVTVSQSDD